MNHPPLPLRPDPRPRLFELFGPVEKIICLISLPFEIQWVAVGGRKFVRVISL